MVQRKDAGWALEWRNWDLLAAREWVIMEETGKMDEEVSLIRE